MLPAAQATRLGMRFPASLSFEDWVELVEKLARLSNASTWMLADAVVYGARFERHGELYRRTLDATGLSYATLVGYAHVARRFPLERRRQALSFSHHRLVTMLSEAEQDAWLKRAERGRWSCGELYHRLSSELRGRRTSPSPPARRLPYPRARTARWAAAATAEGAGLVEWVAAAADAAADRVLELAAG